MTDLSQRKPKLLPQVLWKANANTQMGRNVIWELPFTFHSVLLNHSAGSVQCRVFLMGPLHITWDDPQGAESPPVTGELSAMQPGTETAWFTTLYSSYTHAELTAKLAPIYRRPGRHVIFHTIIPSRYYSTAYRILMVLSKATQGEGREQSPNKILCRVCQKYCITVMPPRLILKGKVCPHNKTNATAGKPKLLCFRYTITGLKLSWCHLTNLYFLHYESRHKQKGDPALCACT